MVGAASVLNRVKYFTSTAAQPWKGISLISINYRLCIVHSIPFHLKPML